MGDYTDLCARLGNGKLTWGDRWEAAAAIRELEARAERAEEAHIFADAARDAADAKLAELEAERDDWKETSARTDDALMRRTRQLADADTRAAAAEATVANVPVDYTDREEREANARLIAAAPELLEAGKPFAAHAIDRAADASEWKDSDTVSIVVTIGELRAIAAAQADYERRILAALEPASGGVEATNMQKVHNAPAPVDATSRHYDRQADGKVREIVFVDEPPLEALVKAASGAALYLEALDAGGVAGPNFFAGQLRLAIAAIKGDAK